MDSLPSFSAAIATQQPEIPCEIYESVAKVKPPGSPAVQVQPSVAKQMPVHAQKQGWPDEKWRNGPCDFLPPLKDRLISQITNGDGDEFVSQLKQTRADQDGTGTHLMVETMKVHKVNIARGIDDILQLYRDKLDSSERQILYDLKTGVELISEIDSLVLYCYRLTMIITFLHQKYYPEPFPEDYYRVDFRPGITADVINKLPFDLMLTAPGSPRGGAHIRGTFLHALNKVIVLGAVSNEYFRRSLMIQQMCTKTSDYMLYPECEDLDKAFFVEAIPLGFHALQVTFQPWKEADGSLHSPMQFLLHDLAHAIRIVRAVVGSDSKNRRWWLLFFREVLRQQNDDQPDRYDALIDLLFNVRHEDGYPTEWLLQSNEKQKERVHLTFFNFLWTPPENARSAAETLLWTLPLMRQVESERKRDVESEQVSPEYVRQVLEQHSRNTPEFKKQVRELEDWKKLSCSHPILIRELMSNINHKMTDQPLDIKDQAVPDGEDYGYMFACCWLNDRETLIRELRKAASAGLLTEDHVPENLQPLLLQGLSPEMDSPTQSYAGKHNISMRVDCEESSAKRAKL